MKKIARRAASGPSISAVRNVKIAFSDQNALPRLPCHRKERFRKKKMLKKNPFCHKMPKK